MMSVLGQSNSERPSDAHHANLNSQNALEADRVEEQVRLNVNLPVDMHRQFKAMAAAEGKFMGTLIRDFVTDYLQGGTRH